LIDAGEDKSGDVGRRRRACGGSEILLGVNYLNNRDDGMDHRLDSFSGGMDKDKIIIGKKFGPASFPAIEDLYRHESSQVLMIRKYLNGLT
jgi:hypothetical protein